jgi:hypothetical protein
MAESLMEKLNSELDDVDWAMLSTHAKHDVVFLVDSSLDLVYVGCVMAEDNTKVFAPWLEEQLIRRPTEQEKENWKTAPQEKIGKGLVIAPYVLVQLYQAD